MRDLKEILADLKECRSKLTDDSITSEELDKIEKRIKELTEEKRNVEDAIERRKKLIDEVDTNHEVLEKFEEPTARSKTYGADSPEYRSAWLKNLATRRSGEKIFGEMNKEERAAFTFTTSNSGDIVPRVTLNKIVELVKSYAPLYEDSTHSNMTSGFGVPRHKAIDQGDAKVTSEGAANDDEQDTFDLLTLDGVEIKKHVVITRKMKWQSIDAFETWLTDHIAKRIANAKEKHILSRLDDSTYGIAASNVMTNKTYTADTIREIFGAIGENGIKRVYANNKTIYTGLFGIEDKMGRPLFTESSTTDPKVAGRILGSEVKEDGNIADDVAYFGVPASLLTNDFEELYIQSDVEPKTFKDIIGGYSLFDAGLENPIAFVKVTFTRAQAAQQGE